MSEENVEEGTEANEAAEVAPKKAKKITVDVTTEGTITLTSQAGTQVVVDAGALSSELQFRAMVHGLRQKLQDSYASEKDSEDAIEIAKKVAEGILGGNWNTRVAGGNGAGTLRASAAKAKAALNNMTDDERANAIALLEKLGQDTSGLILE